MTQERRKLMPLDAKIAECADADKTPDLCWLARDQPGLCRYQSARQISLPDRESAGVTIKGQNHYFFCLKPKDDYSMTAPRRVLAPASQESGLKKMFSMFYGA